MNLYFNAIALDDKKLSKGENVDDNFIYNNGYIKNSFVSLFSARQNNPTIDVAIFVNFEMPVEYQKLFYDNNIRIYNVPFNEFIVPNDMKWSLAFYKLCALKYAINELDYDNYCLVDTDTVCINSLEYLWKECTQNLLLYDIQHSLDIAQAIQMNSEYAMLVNSKKYLTNYGGEFIAGSRFYLTKFIDLCKYYYDMMIEKKLYTKHGDEFIICCAAHNIDLKVNIKSANSYIFRFWTSRFYLISTNYIYNPICILHLPDEKTKGMLCLYNYILKYNALPKKNKLFAIVNLPKIKNNLLKGILQLKHNIYIKVINIILQT